MSRRESFNEEEDMAPCGIHLSPQELQQHKEEEAKLHEPEVIPPPPVVQEPEEEEQEPEEEKDEFDQIDEMFLSLNNALEAKQTALKEKEEALKEKEADLIMRDKIALEELELMRKNREGYLQTATNMVNQKRALDAKENELKAKEEELKAKEQELTRLNNMFASIPPPVPDMMHQSIPFVKGIGVKATWKFYNKFRDLYKFIDARLRQIYANAGENQMLKVQIAACYYLVSFTSKDIKEAWTNLFIFHDLVDEVKDEHLEFVNGRLKKEVIEKLTEYMRNSPAPH